MGKLTSTIGIPIKLLNEAQVCPCPFLLLLPSRPVPRTQSPYSINWKNAGIIDLSLVCSRANAQGHVVTLEITSGQVYRGKLLEGACVFVGCELLPSVVRLLNARFAADRYPTHQPKTI